MTSFDFRPKSGHGGNISDGFPQEIIKVSHLQNLIRANDAKNLLYRAGKAVGPLLQRRKWKIYHLTEFYPNNSSLHGLNVNQGQVIKIRLRTPESQDQFLPLDYIIGTLIHEITHISIGPHSAAFYKLMDDLTAEVERDLISGVDDGGNLKFAAFTGVARKLGYSNSCGQSTSFDQKHLRKLQVEAALRREQNMTRAKGSGQVLGGTTSSSSGIPPISRLLQEFSSSEVNDKTQMPMWTCFNCTYQNSDAVSLCEICGSLSDGRIPSPELVSNDVISTWICEFCTTPNLVGNNRCQVCGVLTRENPTTSTPPNLIVLHDDDYQTPPPTSKRLRKAHNVETDIDEMECMWVCSMCTCTNKLSVVICEICGYRPR